MHSANENEAVRAHLREQIDAAVERLLEQAHCFVDRAMMGEIMRSYIQELEDTRKPALPQSPYLCDLAYAIVDLEALLQQDYLLMALDETLKAGEDC